MKYFYLAAMSLSIALAALTAEARMITYPGGVTIMTSNDVNTNTVEGYYTVTPKYAVGVRHDYWRDSKANMDAGQISYLVKRWNNPGSQANFYLHSGVGVAYEDGDSEPAAFGGMEADWENRRFYTSYHNFFLTAGDIKSEASHTARVGVAPYLGEYGDLHTWLILQTDYNPQDDFSVTPLVRFYKGTSLLEAGVNLDKGLYFHFMHAF